MRAETVEEVETTLAAAVEAAARGLFAAGFVCYEAAPGLDADLRVVPRREDETLPLAWFGFFSDRHDIEPPMPDAHTPLPPLEWQSDTAVSDYHRAIATIRTRIAAGDTYQVNYTTRLLARFTGDAEALWRALAATQGAGYGAFIDLGTCAIASLSPELFFSLRGDRVTALPMKGTRRRGRTTAEDRRLAAELRDSEKERAENLMIVDLLRNDLGRLAVYGGVTVPELFTVETYTTVLQMTSRIEARLRPGVGLADLFRALFPCGSVTGAPKISTMGIISELEASPRGVYCGAIGCIAPDGSADFSVPIRTLVIDRRRGTAEYGVGGGVTWDSDAAAEFSECAAKAAVLSRPHRPFALLETLRFEADSGWYLLDRHLARLRDSAAYFAIPCDEDMVRTALMARLRELPAQGVHKVRLLLSDRGEVTITSEPLPPIGAGPLPVRILCEDPVDSGDPFLFHKTTRRGPYERRAAAAPAGGQVIMVNERGLVTESTTDNVVVRIGEGLWTPPLEDGLLPGVMRAELLATGSIAERSIAVDELKSADEIWLINSVRGWRRAELV